MIKAIAVDDEPMALQVIREHSSKISKLDLVDSFTDPIKALNFLNENTIDLIFLDVNMPDISGLKFSEAINDKNTLIIFTTAHSEYAIESYELAALDYLLKPIEFARFHKAIAKAIENSVRSDKFFFVNTGREQTKICYDDILFVEGDGNYIIYHLDNAKVMVRSTIKEAISRLPVLEFVHVHRSYIVAMRHIDKIQDNHVHIRENKISVGPNFKEALMSKVKRLS